MPVRRTGRSPRTRAGQMASMASMASTREQATLQTMVNNNPAFKQALNQVLNEQTRIEQENENLTTQVTQLNTQVAHLTTQVADLMSEKEVLVGNIEELTRQKVNAYDLLTEVANRLVNLQLPDHLLRRMLAYGNPALPHIALRQNPGLLSPHGNHELPSTTMPQNNEYPHSSVLQTQPSFQPGVTTTMVGDEDFLFPEPDNGGDGHVEGVNLPPMDGRTFLQMLTQPTSQ